ncbi:peroxisomal N(1)-acetyl-spermine/spermidine oxidase-like [Pomacea canaliculata]|uniref:peroxisomal N(1)-acetyl-spermine/spermidine oxidase-like n=1 Tax=Pomacea canaliculata TaxID=400727 RepID=UPI000D7395B7|nr:peroxisomal N(1)-acetyl-spermine/spermidine oxidase-like [Pomacea canaliculata]
MGAQFLHGEEGNPLFALAEKEGLLLDRDADEETGPDTIIQYKDDLFYTPDGHVVPKDVITDLLTRLEDLTMEANRVYDKGEANDITVSMGDYFRQHYPTLFDGIPANEDLKKSMIRWFEAWHILDSGGTVDQLSLPGHGKYRYNPGSGIQETKTGMAALLHVLLRDTVPSACLRLKKPVRTVYWNASSARHWAARLTGHLNGLLTPTLNNNVMLDLRTLVDAGLGEFDPMVDSAKDSKVLRTSGKGSVDDDGNDEASLVVRRNQQNVSAQNGVLLKQSGGDVMVECEDGEIFEADHVIVTSSIGFLQGHPGFFQPSLPAKHYKAVQAMGFGTIAKSFSCGRQEKVATQCKVASLA